MPDLPRFWKTLSGGLRVVDDGGEVKISGLYITAGPLPGINDGLGVRITGGSPPTPAQY